VLYPSLLHFADRGLRRLIERGVRRTGVPATQPCCSRRCDRARADRIARICRRSRLRPPLENPAPSRRSTCGRRPISPTDRLSASIELYGPQGALVEGGRFALNLPEYLSTAQRWREPGCQWEIFEEASPFGSEERRLLHAGRGICDGNSETPTGGSIVVNVMLDYETLPFITVRNPYYEAVRAPDDVPEGTHGT
jgi:hypothetical protein